MTFLGRTVLKNVLSNLVRGGASAIAAIVLPYFLTHVLDRDHFAGWALMLQLAAYANYLDFGLQTAIARYVAQALECRDDARRDRLVNTAFSLLAAMGALALLGLGILVMYLPRIFPAVPLSIMPEFKISLLISGIAAAAALPLSTFAGVLVGMHRNEYSALAIGGSRVLGTLAVLCSVRYTHSLIWLALCIAGCNLLGCAAQLWIVRSLLPAMKLRLSSIQREMAMELVRYCTTLALWSIGMLMISGLDVTIVGSFDYRAVGAYSIAITFINFFTGLNGSVCGAMLAPMAVLQTRKEYGRMCKLVITATQLNSYAGIGLLLIALLFGHGLLTFWVGDAYARQVLPILEILLAAQTVRFIGGAYSTALMAMGQQHHGLLTGMSEAVLNLVLSLAGVLAIGAPGVAWATLIASMFGVALQIFVVMPRVVEFPIGRMRFVMKAIGQPILALAAPIVWVVVYAR